jgi:hypothetical protein
VPRLVVECLVCAWATSSGLTFAETSWSVVVANPSHQPAAGTKLAAKMANVAQAVRRLSGMVMAVGVPQFRGKLKPARVQPRMTAISGEIGLQHREFNPMGTVHYIRKISGKGAEVISALSVPFGHESCPLDQDVRRIAERSERIFGFCDQRL